MILNECIPASSTLLYHRAIARRAASFMVFFEAQFENLGELVKMAIFDA